MTHSLHRQGTCESLRKDYPVLAMVARQFDNVDDEAKRRTLEKLQAIFDVFVQHSPTNLGSCYVPGTRAHGMTDKELRAGLKANGFVGAAWSDREGLEEMLQELKERDYGISIIVSGLIDEVFRTCDAVGLQPHTIDLALGIWGNKKLLPKAELLEISTMCGHALVPTALVADLLRSVRKGKMTAEEAALEIAKPCVCAIFNQQRAAELIGELAKQE